MDNPAFQIREMKLDDIPAGMRLKEVANWNQTREDWKFLIDIGVLKLAATVEESVIGTITDIKYADRFHWIGMVLVDPAFRRKGIASRLMQEGMSLLDDSCPFRLDATEEGKELYVKLGFEVEQYLYRYYSRDASRALTIQPEVECHRITQADLKRVSSFDSEVFGADRSEVLNYLLHAKPSYAWFFESGGFIQGYCAGRPGSNGDQIGPVVAREQEIAESLLVRALGEAGSKYVIIDSYYAKKNWNAFLSNLGFQRQRPLIRMFEGGWTEGGRPEYQYAIAGPELG